MLRTLSISALTWNHVGRPGELENRRIYYPPLRVIMTLAAKDLCNITPCIFYYISKDSRKLINRHCRHVSKKLLEQFIVMYESDQSS